MPYGSAHPRPTMLPAQSHHRPARFRTQSLCVPVPRIAALVQRARTVHRLDDTALLSVARADPALLVAGDRPVLIDEWQRLPQSWDVVRRAVDAGAPGGSFLLAGSAQPIAPPMHSGAGRISQLRMRPLAFSERGLQEPAVSLGDLLSGDRVAIAGRTDVTVREYAKEIARSGLPGIRDLTNRARTVELDGYITRVVQRDVVDETGVRVRSEQSLRRWMAAYAAASSTTTSWEKVRDAASPGEDTKPNRKATDRYREALSRLFLLDEVPAWLPSRSRLARLGRAAKHQLADPALAARLLGMNAGALLRGEGSAMRDGPLFGALFESLVTLSVRVYAQASDARVGHLRLQRGEREVDVIVEAADDRVLAVELLGP
jgi:predicted AAA+ superfamily ATPase